MNTNVRVLLAIATADSVFDIELHFNPLFSIIMLD
jgi:hypothetical protein